MQIDHVVYLKQPQYFLMLTSRRKCFQKLRDGFMESSNCSESHSYDPFHSQEATNATVKAVSSVVFLSKQNTTLTVSCWLIDSLLMTF